MNKNIEKALAAREQQFWERVVNKAKFKYNPRIGDERELNVEKFINRIKTTSKLEGISKAEAVRKLFSTMSFMTEEDNYKKQIREHLTPQDRANIRKHLAKQAGTNYRDTSINIDSFFYVKGIGLVNADQSIVLNLRSGVDSNDPEFVEIEFRDALE